MFSSKSNFISLQDKVDQTYLGFYLISLSQSEDRPWVLPIKAQPIRAAGTPAH